MVARLFALLGVLTLLMGCGPTYYRNSLNPSYGQVEFDRDWYECQKENSRASAYVNPYYGVAGTTVDYDMARACLAARGWRPSSASTPASSSSDSATPQLRKSTDPVCASGMYWDSSKGRCVKVGG